jgi:DNA-binding transcriptional regulator LsrR (DeoR family)
LKKCSGGVAVEGGDVSTEERGLAARAAWLSYIGGLTHEEIAQRLRVSRAKATRLIAAAQHAGLVRVFVEGPVAECVQLENALIDRFGLTFCEVAPDLGEEGLPLQALAAAGARYLLTEIDRGERDLIGIGHGRTLAALVDRLPRLQRPQMRFVSLLGSLTRKSAANPYDVIHRLAELAGGEGYFVPAPFFADSVEDRRVLLSQRSVGQVLALGREAPLSLVGIGEVGPTSQLVGTGMLTPAESAELVAAGAVGEVLGLFLDAQGRTVDAEINSRAVAVALEDLQGREVVAVAGGPSKTEAIRAVLRTGFVTGLITDEATAGRLVGDAAALGAGRASARAIAA